MYPFRPSDMSFVEDYRLSTCLHLRIKARQAARLQKQAVQRSNGVVLFFSNIRLRSHPKDSAFHARLCVRFRTFSIPQRHIPTGHIILRHFPFFAKLVPVLRIEYFLRAPNVACAHLQEVCGQQNVCCYHGRILIRIVCFFEKIVSTVGAW